MAPARSDPRHVPRRRRASRRSTAASVRAPRASPASSRGLEYAHRKFGKLPWRELVEPAIALARDGVELDAFHADEMAAVTRNMADYAAKVPEDQRGAARGDDRDAAAPSARATARPTRRATRGGSPILPARSRRSPPAARTRSTAARSPGRWRRAWLRWAASGPRPISPATRPSSASRSASRTTDTTSSRWPPPSGGGITMRQILAASDALHLERLDWDSVDRIHLYVEALRRIFADSTQLLGDPGFVEIPLTTHPRHRLHPEAHGRHRPRQGDAVVGDQVGRGARPSISRRRTSRSSTAPAWRWPTPTR